MFEVLVGYSPKGAVPGETNLAGESRDTSGEKDLLGESHEP